MGVVDHERGCRRCHGALESHDFSERHDADRCGVVETDRRHDNRLSRVDEQNQHPLDGVVEGNRITLTTHPRPGRTVAFAKCELTADGDKMSGTTEGGDLGGKANIELVRDNK